MGRIYSLPILFILLIPVHIFWKGAILVITLEGAHAAISLKPSNPA